MNRRLEILSEIDRIEDNICANCTIVIPSDRDNSYCTTKCITGLKLQKLGKRLLEPRRSKIRRTLEKGKNMTTGDILFLLDNDVYKRDIFKALGVGKTKGHRLINEILKGRGEEIVSNT